MRVYISADLEGISGVTLFEQTREEGPAYQQARHLLMGDINAAVQGCLDGGAEYIRVVDDHGSPLNVVPEELHPGAEYISGGGFPSAFERLGDGFDCGMFVGYHAMNRTPDGILYHTRSSRWDSRYWYNGIESGEISQDALIAGHFGIPIVMLTGDAAACRETAQFLGEEVLTVSVKKGFGRQCCRMLAPERAHELIREGACAALQRISQCRPHILATPLHARMDRLAEMPPPTATPEEILAAPRLTFERICDTQLEIFDFRDEHLVN